MRFFPNFHFLQALCLGLRSPRKTIQHLPTELVFEIISDLVTEYLHVIFTKGQPTWDTTRREQLEKVDEWNAIFVLLSTCRFWNGVTRSLLVKLFCDKEDVAHL